MLSLYAAMKPKRKIERHIIFKGKRPPTVTIPSTEGRPELQPIVDKLKSPLYYSHLVRDITKDEFGSHAHGTPGDPPEPKVDTFAPEFPPKQEKREPLEWCMEWRDIPIAGGKGIVTQRGSLSMTMWDDDPFPFLGIWGWEYVDP